MWIESHQELLRHPKTLAVADALYVSVPTVVGHLHALWWWAMDYAQDGDLSNYTDAAIAKAAMWEGDPDVFVEALTECGPGTSFGFIEDDRTLHDWEEYGGKLHAKRAEDAARKRRARAKKRNADPESPADHTESPSTPRPVPVQRTSDGRDADVRVTALVEDSRGQDRTEEHAPPDGGIVTTVDVDGFDLPFPTRTAGRPLTDAIVEWAVTVGLADHRFRTPLEDARLAVSTIAQTLGKKGKAITAAIAVCGDYICSVRQLDELDRRSWGMLQSQVSTHGPSAVLSALAEALDRGAGLDGGHEAKGTVAVVEYALAVLKGELQDGAA